MKNLLTLGNSQDFDKLIASSSKVVVDFYADWCGPCRAIAPILEKFCEKHSTVTVIKINVDEFVDLAQKFMIRSIPTLLIYKDGKKVASHLGAISLADLESLVL